ncbi:hypothetical protein IAU60_002519 [Kwoniella sp. DSM 27419]
MPSSPEYDEWRVVHDWLLGTYPGFETTLVLRDLPGLERGLVTSRSLKPGETLLHIPAASMLNPLTLFGNSPIPSHLFPQTRSSSRASTSVAKPSVDGNAHAESSAKRPKVTPTRKLDTTQLLTLHLVLTKDPKGRYPSPWQPYIHTLPRSFRSWHPLTWLVPPTGDSSRSDWETWSTTALAGLSASTRKKLDEVNKRFEEDYEVIKEVLAEEEPFKSHNLTDGLGKEEILWAWLTVNTRSISIPLGLPGPSERMNHTLVPIMDFINHSSDPDVITSRVKQLPTASKRRSSSHAQVDTQDGNGSTAQPLASRPGANGAKRVVSPPSSTGPGSTSAHLLRQADKHMIPGKIDLCLVCPDRGLAEGEEVLFEYGAHGSSTLFVEYGFCESPPEPALVKAGDSGAEAELSTSLDASGAGEKAEAGTVTVHAASSDEGAQGWLGMRYGEVDVSSYVDELWQSQDEEDAQEKKEVLESIGCWGGNTLHALPSPAHPSHPLLMTLRLLHLPASSPKIPSIASGLVTYISPQNETAAMMTLEEICRKIVKAADKRGKALEARLSEDHADKEQDGVLKMLRGMAEEERVIAGKVLERLLTGEEFS